MHAYAYAYANDFTHHIFTILQEKMDFAKRDFQFCWRNTLNRDNFDSNIYFEDPISKFTNYTGECSKMHSTSLTFIFCPFLFAVCCCIISKVCCL